TTSTSLRIDRSEGVRVQGVDLGQAPSGPVSEVLAQIVVEAPGEHVVRTRFGGDERRSEHQSDPAEVVVEVLLQERDDGLPEDAPQLSEGALLLVGLHPHEEGMPDQVIAVAEPLHPRVDGCQHPPEVDPVYLDALEQLGPRGTLAEGEAT